MSHLPYDPEASRVIAAACEEAGRLGHDYFDASHVLVALCDCENQEIQIFLKTLGLNSAVARSEHSKLVKPGEHPVPPHYVIPARTWLRVLDAASRSARCRKRPHIEVRDLLVGTLRDYSNIGHCLFI